MLMDSTALMESDLSSTLTALFWIESINSSQMIMIVHFQLKLNAMLMQIESAVYLSYLINTPFDSITHSTGDVDHLHFGKCVAYWKICTIFIKIPDIISNVAWSKSIKRNMSTTINFALGKGQNWNSAFACEWANKPIHVNFIENGHG